MQGIYTYIPETNYVSREYSVASILLLLFMVLISLVPVLNLLYFYFSTFRSMRAVPNMAIFCNCLTSCFRGMVLTYFLNDYYYWYHLCFYIPHALYFYCKVFILESCSASFVITFLSPEIATSINIHVPFSLSRIIMSGLLVGIILSVCAC